MIEKIDKLPSLLSIVKEFGLLQNTHHSKSLGQNFLLNKEILANIVSHAENLEDSIIIEIGSGPGGLTREILKKHPKKLIVIEKDTQCINALKSLVSISNNILEITQMDALLLKIEHIKNQFPNNPLKIISNLPYNVGTKILLNLLYDIKNIDMMILMFQKEVADRITAKPNTKDYGRLSVISQYLTNCKKVMTLSPGAFTPAPKVYSSLIKFIPKNNINQGLTENLGKLTNALFQSRRKMIRNGLSNIFNQEKISTILTDTNIPENIRPENLSIEDFVRIAELM